MTLFWGDNDGGENPGLWDHNHTINNVYSDGRVSHYIDSLSGGANYYYRWMGKNSVIDEAWSKPTTDGLIHWWTFDQINGNQVIDSVGRISGHLHGISAGSRTFAYKELGLPFTGQEDEKLTERLQGYLHQARTVSLWIQTLINPRKLSTGGMKTVPHGPLALIKVSPFAN